MRSNAGSPKTHMVKMSLQQIFMSPVIYISVLAIAVLCYIVASPYFSGGLGTDGVVYIMNLLIGLSMAKKLIVLFSSLAGVGLFCHDWNNRFIQPTVSRCGVVNYSFSRALTCWLSSFAASFLGMIIFAGALRLFMPICTPNLMSSFTEPPYGELLTSPFPFLYIAATAAVFSLATAMWTLVGLAFSAFIPNHFVAMTATIVASYILEELTRFFPAFLSLYGLTRSANLLNQGALVSFLYFVSVFAVLSVIIGLIFHFQVRRRVRNEVV